MDSNTAIVAPPAKPYLDNLATQPAPLRKYALGVLNGVRRKLQTR
jgi:hypothetical protein